MLDREKSSSASVGEKTARDAITGEDAEEKDNAVKRRKVEGEDLQVNGGGGKHHGENGDTGGNGDDEDDDVDDDLPLISLKRKDERSSAQESVLQSKQGKDTGKETVKEQHSPSAEAVKEEATLNAISHAPERGQDQERGDDDDDDDDDVPLSMLKKVKTTATTPTTAKTAVTGNSNTKPRSTASAKTAVAAKASTTAETEAPVGSSLKAKKVITKKKVSSASGKVSSTPAKKPTSSSSSSSKKVTTSTKKKKKVVKKKTTGKASGGASGSSSTTGEVTFKPDEYVFVGGNGENGGDEHRWWEESAGGNEQKWQSLSHHGVIFPPAYVPTRVPLVYDGADVILPPAVEEIGMFYAAKLETDYVKKPVFNKNYFNDFRIALRRADKDLFKRVKDFRKCDFSKMKAHLLARKEREKAQSKEDKKAARESEAERVKKYTVALVDGREEKVGNFRIEPPGLFLGRGEHPLMGKVKKRIYPEDVTINVGAKDPVPECHIPGHKWGKVIHNNTVTWLAVWKDTITNGSKYVWLAAHSTFKTISDAAKFEKARKLRKYIEKIRSDYRKGWSSRDLMVQQRSVALYLIDVLALRVGNEKGEDKADTVGCCSLRVEHLSFEEPDRVEFDFLGKDSIRYLNSVKVERKVFECLRKLSKGKDKSRGIFDRLTPTSLNDYLRSLMEGLSAKVLRTYNASLTLDRLLQKTDPNLSPHDRLVFFNQQNKEVAILCNHQRSLPKAHDDQMDKLGRKLEQAEEWLKTLEKAEEELKKGKEEHVIVTQMVRETPKITPEMTDAEKSAERKRTADIVIPKERKMNADAVATNKARARERIDKLTAEMQTKDDLKTVALGTSKINYLDPRIAVAWCKKNDTPIEKIFTKTLMLKFAWSMESMEGKRSSRSNG